MPDTQPTPERFSDWNEEMIVRHDPELTDHPRLLVRWIERRRLAAALKLLGKEAGNRVLAVGCGAGRELEAAAVRHKYGLDLSRAMLRRARRRLGTATRLVRADAEILPYRDDSFDCALCLSVLSHVLRPERVLWELRRVVKPGGRIVVSVSNEPAIERGLKLLQFLRLTNVLLGGPDPAGEHVYASEYHLHRFSRSRLRAAARGILAEKRCLRLPFLLWPAHLVAVYEVPPAVPVAAGPPKLV